MKIYANLLGTWTDITNSGTVQDNANPVEFFKENLKYNNEISKFECFKYDWINVQYNNVNYKIHVSMIQITN